MPRIDINPLGYEFRRNCGTSRALFQCDFNHPVETKCPQNLWEVDELFELFDFVEVLGI